MEVTKEDITQFKNYIKNHVNIVSLLGNMCFNKDYSKHDLDKQEAEGDDLNIYAKRNAVMNKKGWPSKEEKALMDRITGHHVKINAHHPEYWDDSILEDEYVSRKPPVCHAEKMSKDALEEMCCDWAAVALKKNVSLSDWYNSTVDKRFIFTEEQKDFIKKYLSKIEQIIKDNDIRFPGKGKYSAESSKFKENKMKTAIVTFGRCNPPTVGHMVLFEKIHSSHADGKFVYLSHKQEKPGKRNPLRCKNPLPYDVKYNYVKEFLAEAGYNDIDLVKSPAINIINACQEIYQEGFEKIILCLGSDRTEDMVNLIKKYNGMFDENGLGYDFQEIDYITAGEERVDEGDDLNAMSASKQREFAVNGNYEEFRKGVPTIHDDIALDLFNDVRTYMGIE